MPLTMENSGAALVAGAALPADDARAVEVLRPFMFSGERVEAGAIVHLPARFAREMVSAGKARMHTAAAPAAEPAAPAAAPRPTPARKTAPKD